MFQTIQDLFYQMLAQKCWPKNVDPQYMGMARKCWPEYLAHNPIGLHCMANKFWPTARKIAPPQTLGFISKSDQISELDLYCFLMTSQCKCIRWSVTVKIPQISEQCAFKELWQHLYINQNYNEHFISLLKRSTRLCTLQFFGIIESCNISFRFCFFLSITHHA